MENQKLPEGVELFYTDRAVHLTTNEALMTYLRQKGNGSLPLSRAILDGYAALMRPARFNPAEMTREVRIG